MPPLEYAVTGYNEKQLCSAEDSLFWMTIPTLLLSECHMGIKHW